MKILHQSFSVQSEARPTFHDVTDSVRALTEKSGLSDGLAIVYSQHTTCSVLIQEKSDDVDAYGEQFILQDMVGALSKFAPTCTTNGQYQHPGPIHLEIAQRERGEEAWWSLNTDAHLRSVLLGRSVTVPFTKNGLLLGEFGTLYFADFDQTRARERTVWVTLIGQEAEG